jgi:2-keto-4-pentenoate hydratase/2-oxohepta-3-ene-1,7-dioic acid hydratase in catechol pathway
MFTPLELDLERGWPGKIDGDRVIQVAAQTLQAFFTGGGMAREHAEFPLAEVRLLAPVLRPPSIRVFDGPDFHFANPTSVYGPDEDVPVPSDEGPIEAVLRPATVIGALEQIGGFTVMNDWHVLGVEGPKAWDFATSLGPVVVTPDENRPPGVDWEALIEYARRNTELLPGDLIAADAVQRLPVSAGEVVELELDGIGVLRNRVG